MTGWAIDAALASALLMAVVLVLRAPVRRLFGPTVAYALWALPALRLALPPMPESWRASAATPMSQATEIVVHNIVPEFVPESVNIEQAGWAGAVAMLWLAGAGAFLLFHLVQYAAFRARLLRRHQPLDRVDGVRVVLSPAAHGPLAFGVLSRYIALPADLDARYDADEQALALAHELGHHARGDLIANWVALAVLALHWWNPLSWIAHRAFRADQELANDARVLRTRGPDAAHAYARAILKAAHGGPKGLFAAVACHLHTIDDLKGRLRMLKNGPASPRRVLTGAVTVTFLASTGLLATASGTSAAAAVKTQVGETIGVNLDAVSDVDLADLNFTDFEMPTPPTPPAPPAVPAPPRPAVAVSIGQVVPAPPMPPVPDALPVPPVPPVPPIASVPGTTQYHVFKDGNGRVSRRFYYRRDGKPGAPMIDFGNRWPFGPDGVPEIRESQCGSGERPTIRNERRDGKRVTIICTDRIERLAERSVRLADRHAELAANSIDISRRAMGGALRGLRSARATIEASAHLTSEQRRLALDGIAQSITEMEREIAQAN